MTHALNNASHTSACAELGISVGTNRNQTTLTRHASINLWSFYRSGSIAPNATTKFIELTPRSSDDKLGDFRGYNHNAAEPYPYDVYPSGKTWGPGGTYVEFIFQLYVEELNLREVRGGSVPYFSIKYYMSAANRTSKTSAVRTFTVVATETANTPPTGHTNNQTARPASASQLITDSNFPASYLATPDDTVYCDFYISDASGTEIARFGTTQADGHVDVDTHEAQDPEILTNGIGPTPFPAGYTVIYPVIAATNDKCLDDSPIAGGTVGTTNITFYVGMHGVYSTATRSVAGTSYTIRISYDGSTKDVVVGTLYSSVKKQVSTTLPGSKTWAYDKDATITIVSVTYGSYTTC